MDPLMTQRALARMVAKTKRRKQIKVTHITGDSDWEFARIKWDDKTWRVAVF